MFLYSNRGQAPGHTGRKPLPSVCRHPRPLCASSFMGSEQLPADFPQTGSANNCLGRREGVSRFLDASFAWGAEETKPRSTLRPQHELQFPLRTLFSMCFDYGHSPVWRSRVTTGSEGQQPHARPHVNSPYSNGVLFQQHQREKLREREREKGGGGGVKRESNRE